MRMFPARMGDEYGFSDKLEAPPSGGSPDDDGIHCDDIFAAVPDRTHGDNG